MDVHSPYTAALLRVCTELFFFSLEAKDFNLRLGAILAFGV